MTMEPAAALDLLQQSPAPSAVLITDAALTKRSSDTHLCQTRYRAFFAKTDLTWQVVTYHRTDVALNSKLATTLIY
ncbi:unnamed protein product [Clonostachys rhizophaga]|uniref:Uncharacterized protein n=1 Tax=Clonostachys rhizophaga TaxID=160324 RepID=A0A9N9VVL0_9HYPO|nr:unnamed protein product [Clonostachys rhizophaga]